MDLRDLFVASVAIILGGMMLYSAIVNQGWCFEMKVARVVAESQGREKARTLIGSVGTFLLLVGLYLLLAPSILVSLMQKDYGNDAYSESHSNELTSLQASHAN